MFKSRRTGAMVAVASFAVVVGIAGCGSSSSGSSASPTSSSSSGGGSSAYAADLQAAYNGELGTVPSGTNTPEKNISLWVASCGQVAPSCSTPAATIATAAKSIGWTVHVCDGKLNPAGFASCINQAVAAKANVVIPIGFGCDAARSALEAADKAGVKTVANGGVDCQDFSKAANVFSAPTMNLPNQNVLAWFQEIGKLQAQYLIGKTNGTAKVVIANFTDQVWGPVITKAIESELKTCSGCSVEGTVDVGNADQTNGTLATKIGTELLQHPTANALAVPVDQWFVAAGLATKIESLHRSNLISIGWTGDSGNIALIKAQKGETATVGFSNDWQAYGSVDNAIRVLAGKKPVAQGVGIQVVDATHNMPTAAGARYEPAFNWKAAYLKNWGVSS